MVILTCVYAYSYASATNALQGREPAAGHRSSQGSSSSSPSSFTSPAASLLTAGFVVVPLLIYLCFTCVYAHTDTHGHTYTCVYAYTHTLLMLMFMLIFIQKTHRRVGSLQLGTEAAKAPPLPPPPPSYHQQHHHYQQDSRLCLYVHTNASLMCMRILTYVSACTYLCSCFMLTHVYTYLWVY